jgi:hypothetical protein
LFDAFIIIKKGYWGNLVMIIILLVLNLPMTAGYGFAVIASGFIFKFWNGKYKLFTSNQNIIIVVVIIK